MGRDIDALLLLGRCLGVDESDAARTALRRDLGSAGRDWVAFAGLANRQRVTPAVWASLRRKECCDVLPEDIRSYLAAIFERNARRNGFLRQQACEVAAVLNASGIRPVVLKGGLQLVEPGFDPAVRIMCDLDFLLPRDGFEAAAEALRRTGYVDLQIWADRPEYSLTMSRAGALATIDLHRDLGPQRRVLPADAALAAAMPLPVAGAEFLTLSPTHRVLHEIVNTAVTDPHYRMATISLRRLYDLALLSRRHAAAIEWDAVRRGLAQEGLEPAVSNLLCLAERLFGLPLPSAVARTVRGRLYTSRYLLQVRRAPLGAVGRLWGRAAHTFSRTRMDYFRAGGSAWSRLGARWRHARSILRQPEAVVLKTIARDIRAK